MFIIITDILGKVGCMHIKYATPSPPQKKDKNLEILIVQFN